jgi:hypothetical protein
MVPHGPDMGCHMAPIRWLMLFQNLFGINEISTYNLLFQENDLARPGWLACPCIVS